jgi:hypothetical protein
VTVELHQIVTKTIADVRVLRIELVRPAIITKGFLESGESIEHESSQMQRRRLTGLQSLASVETDKGFFQQPQLSQKHATLVGGIPTPGIDLERLPEAGRRVHRASSLGEGLAEIAPQFRIVRLDLYRFVEDLQRIVMTFQIQQRGSKRRQIGGLWVFPDRARRPFYGMIELLRIEAHQGHEMQQFRMLGARFKRLLTAKLGIEMSPGPHVAKNGLAERGLHGQRETLEVGFGSLASGPALATTHLCISNFSSNYL